jgi:hypothetical protein
MPAQGETMGIELKKLSLDKETVQRLRGSVPGFKPTTMTNGTTVTCQISDSRCCCEE